MPFNRQLRYDDKSVFFDLHSMIIYNNSLHNKFFTVLSFILLPVALSMADDYSLNPYINFFHKFNQWTSIYIEEVDLNNFIDFFVSTSLNLLHVNCKSVNKNFNSLNSLLQVSGGQLSVIAISETWLSDVSEIRI